MNEWYQPVYQYKKDENLTWSQLGTRWGVSDRTLRRKDRQPPARVVRIIRKSLPDRYIPANLKSRPDNLEAQADIFTNQHLKENDSQVPNSNEPDTPEVKTDKTPEQSTKPEDSMTTPTAKLRNKTLRDPIQVDIELTPFEVRVIDTPDFQRLRYIKQLGTASYVFPGATHNRFEHSIGTLSAAQIMIDSVNNNPETQLHISDDITKLIRMCALLHDITHIPFGHILEDEGFLFERHDKTDNNIRWDKFLGPASDIGRRLIDSEGEDFRKQVFKYLTTPRESIGTLEHPYVIDIVANTICADLIDYLARDTTYAGLKETFDPRFLKSLLIASYEKPGKPKESYKNRLVISLLKDKRVRRDVISEVMHLLRLRYSLAEKVYYHHAKIKTSAMLIEAVQAGIINKPSDFNETKLCEMKFGDNELLVRLMDSEVPISKKLIEKLIARSLYKPVYMLTYSAPTPEDTSWEEKIAIIDRFRKNPEERFNLERNLEKWNRLPEGSVIIYCPTEDMNLKQIKTLCLWRDGEIKPLVKIPGEKLESEARSINEAHMELWKLFVLLERDLPGEQEIIHHLASDCLREFGHTNCIKEFRTVEKPPLERYIENWATNRPDLNVIIPEKEQLIGMRSRYAERLTQTPPSYEELEQDLSDIRKSE